MARGAFRVTNPVQPVTRGTRTFFYGARFMNQMGQALYFSGIFWLVAREPNAAFGASAVMAAMMAASILFGLPGGAIADRFGPARAALAGGAARGFVIAATLAAGLLIDDGSRLPLLIAAAFVYSGVSQVYSPAELSLVRSVAAHRPSSGHAMLVVLQYAGQGAALAVVAGLALLYRSPWLLVGSGALSYVAVVLCTRLFATRLGEAPPLHRPHRGFAFAEPLRFFRVQPGAVLAGFILTFMELVAKAAAIALPYYIAHDLGLSRAHAMFLAVPAVAGVAVGLFWSSRFVQPRRSQQVMRLALAATVVSLLVLGGLDDGLMLASSWIQPETPISTSTPSFLAIGIALPAAIVLGLCFAVAPVSARAHLSAAAPRDQQSRVFALQSCATDCVAIIPLLLSGIGAEVVGAELTFLFLGLLGAVALLWLERGPYGSRGWANSAAPDAAIP